MTEVESNIEGKIEYLTQACRFLELLGETAQQRDVIIDDVQVCRVTIANIRDAARAFLDADSQAFSEGLSRLEKVSMH